MRNRYAPLAGETARMSPRGAVILVLVLVAATLAGSAGAATRSPVTPQIVGGTSAPITSFPFQAALWSRAAPSPQSGQFCGASIVDATHVVTAAHCVFDPARGQASRTELIDALAGTVHLRSASDPPYGGEVRDVPVSAISFHPAYDPRTADYDVALLTLSGAVYSGSPVPDGSTAIAPIPLISPSEAATYADPSSTSPVTVSGWGDVNPEPVGSPPSPSLPADLRSVDTHLVAEATCRQNYLGVTSITDRMLCAGEPAGGKASCSGDSGGPLVVDAAATPSPPDDYVLAGIVSAAAGCAQPGYPGIFTRIADPAVTSFLTSNPPPTPRRVSVTTISGTPEVGEQLTCGPGSWVGEPTYRYQFGRDPGGGQPAVAVTAPSASPAYTLIAADAGAGVFCEVKASNAGGYGYGDSALVRIAAGPSVAPAEAPASAIPAAPDTIAPRVRVARRHCTLTKCTLTLVVADPIPTAGVRAPTGTHRLLCSPRATRARICTRSKPRRAPRITTLGAGRFLAVVAGLARGTHQLSFSAVDLAGNRQVSPTRIKVWVKGAGRKHRRR